MQAEKQTDDAIVIANNVAMAHLSKDVDFSNQLLLFLLGHASIVQLLPAQDLNKQKTGG